MASPAGGSTEAPASGSIGSAPTPGSVATSVEQTDEAVTRMKQAAARHRADAARPNFHTSLHYSLSLEDYAVPTNCNTYMDEAKHKDSKQYIRLTNHRNPERDILRHETEEQSLHLMIHGGLCRDEPSKQTVELVQTLNAEIPSLFACLLPRSEQTEVLAEDEVIGDEIQVVADNQHKAPSGVA